MLRSFFARIIEWDWDDAPRRNPVMAGDIPTRPEPLPKFLDDRDAAKLMATARAASDPRDRLVVELLARTGLRANEACGLDADAVVRIGSGHWLRVPVGKLRNDRFVPLHPQLVELLQSWCAANIDHIRTHRHLIADHRGTVKRDQLARIVKRVARQAGIGHVHPTEQSGDGLFRDLRQRRRPGRRGRHHGVGGGGRRCDVAVVTGEAACGDDGREKGRQREETQPPHP